MLYIGKYCNKSILSDTKQESKTHIDMKKFLCLIGLVVLVSCSKENGDVDVLDGVYVDENKWGCLIINEYEKGKLGYYLFDIRDGISSDTSIDSYAYGLMSIKMEGKDSIAVFTAKKNKIKTVQFLPVMFDCEMKIKRSDNILCFGEDKKSAIYFGKMNAKGEIKEIKDAVKATMRAKFSEK